MMHFVFSREADRLTYVHDNVTRSSRESAVTPLSVVVVCTSLADFTINALREKTATARATSFQNKSIGIQIELRKGLNQGLNEQVMETPDLKSRLMVLSHFSREDAIKSFISHH